MRIPCAMIRDLLPLYAEKMVEPETESLIREHLENCSECRHKLSGIEAGVETTVDTAKPLQAIRKEIRKRRRYAAIIAALCVFVAVYTLFYHANEMRSVPWEEGLIEVKGTEERPYAEVYGQDAVSDESPDSTVEVLILRVDSRINGTDETVFQDDDGTRTIMLQGWSSNGIGGSAGEYNEMAFCPVPDRVIYEGGNQQRLLWGEPLNGGVETLPRLALGYYVILAIVLATVSGITWLFLHSHDKSWIVRQIFFAPVSYLLAHFLIKGCRTTSFFMERDFCSIVSMATALYILLSLLWQVILRRKKER